MRPRPFVPVLALAALLAAVSAPGTAQVLRLSALQIPDEAATGPWVSFRVATQSRNFPPREFTQRAAIVSAEGIGDEAGVWVELKTVDPQTGTRIDRGFFSRDPGAEGADEGAGSPRMLHLTRVQRLHPDGRLYEYPPSSDAPLRADEEITTMGLFEVSDSRPPLVDTLGVDTLRIGRKTLSSLLLRKQWVGSDEWWDDQDTTIVQRVVLTLTVAECPDVPLTGYTRSVFEVRTATFAATDTLAEHAAPLEDPAGNPPIYRAELTLGDLGTGAVPEVTQEPEPPPAAEEPGTPAGPTR